MSTDANGRLAELRHVAVLFADLQGFTNLCERLDPEEVVELLQVIYARLGEEVERYGGHIDKVLGDGLMVLFGAPQAREDDGLRALMAGLAMQKAMTDLQPWLRERLGQALGMRVGIDAGPVVYGVIGPDAVGRATVIGDAANVAARLQRIAAPGQVVVSDRARRLASRQVQFRKLGVTPLEGRRAPVEAFIAVAPYAPIAGDLAAMTSSMAGRAAETQRLLALYDAAALGRTGLVLLTGESGIGKTRLMVEFAALLRGRHGSARPLVIHVRNRWEVSVSYRPYDMLTQALGVRPNVRGDGRPATLRAAMEAADPTKSEGDCREAVEALRDLCGRMPVVLLVDDWDWADPLDAALLANLIQSVAGLPILVLVSGRRVELPLPAGLSDVSVNRMKLTPLDSRESWMLLQQHPAFGALPADMAESLLQWTGGNPAHVLESVEALIDQGVVSPSGEGWRIREENLAVAMPETIRNSVLSRLDAADPDSVHLLRLCSVMGAEISLPLLAAVAERAETELRDEMHSLVEAGLVVSLPEAADRYCFRSELIREVAYHTMLKRHRQELHRAVGLALEKRPDARAADLALHFVRAGLGERAVRYGLAASGDMLARGEHERVLLLLDEMRAHIPEDDANQRAVLLERLGEAYVASGNTAGGVEAFLQALGMTRDPVGRGRLMTQAGWAYAIQGRADVAMKHYQRAREVLSSVEAEPEQALVAASMRLLYDRP